MADRPPNETKPEKKEFGTGLRAQLERRRDGDAEAPKAPEAQPNVELRFELTARPHDLEAVESADVEALRAELAAARAREEELRRTLAEQSVAYEGAVGTEQDLARRAMALDEREIKLAEFQGELEDRERRVRELLGAT